MNPITTASAPNLIAKPDPVFNKSLFEAAIWNKCYSVVMEKAIKCPCSTNQNQPLSDCRNCGGIGWFFINPIQTQALITNLNENTQYKNWSVELLGTISVSLRDSERIGNMDRITIVNNNLTDNKAYFSELITLRGDQFDEFVFLAYRPIDIIGIWLFESSTTKLHKLDVDEYEISSTNPYVIDFDFDFSTISNFNGTISVLYTHEVQYHIMDIPHLIRNSYKINNNGQDEQIVLPVNAIARRSHLIESIANRNGQGILDN
jgi:hypothetical protein